MQKSSEPYMVTSNDNLLKKKLKLVRTLRGLHIVLEYKKATLLPWNASLHLLIICTYCLVLVKKCAIEGIAK